MAADTTAPRTFCSVRDLRKFESPTAYAKDWPKTMASNGEYLRSYLGVVWKNEAVPANNGEAT